MKLLKAIWLGSSTILYCLSCFGQNKTTQTTKPADTVKASGDTTRQRDLIDIAQKLFKPNTSPDARKTAKKLSFSVIPSVGYTLTTGFAADVAANVAFYTDKTHKENLSSIDGDVSYDSNNQKLFVSRSNIWSKDNNYHLVSDIRWERFPENTYGLGTFTTTNKQNNIDFVYVKIYPTLYKKLADIYYVGVGYNLDYHYQITAKGNADKSVSDFQKYGQFSDSRSSGLNADFLIDSRKNAINPIGGSFLSVVYRKNATFLGSNANWQSLYVDARKYFKVSSKSNNVLAFWSLVWLTNGNVPYLDLPATSGDLFNNSGRGYIEGRFRGQNMLYLEGEYRFGITRNGLLGGVVFANGESLSEYPDNSFKKIAPATGTGIRIKVNKHSNTNVCIDYAVGINGSRGFFVNLGEVF